MEGDLEKLIILSSVFMMSYSMISKFMHNYLFIPEPIINILYGIAIGSHGMGLLKPHYVFSKVILTNAAQIILCLQTMNVAFSLPRGYLSKNWKDMFSLVVIVGFLKCSLVFGFLWMIGMKGIQNCWAIASSLTPTDPILSFSIVKGRFAKKNVHKRLRTLLAAESGINDGFGIFVLNISIEVLNYYVNKRTPLMDKTNISERPYNIMSSSGSAKQKSMLEVFGKAFNEKPLLPFYNFMINTMLKKIVFSSVVGYSIGYVTQRTTKYCSSLNLIKSETLATHPLILSLVSLGLMEYLDGSELICIFFTGLALNEDDWYPNEKNMNQASDIIENLLSNVFFIFLGATLDFKKITWFKCISSLIIILFARLIVVLGMYKMIDELKTLGEALFVGWFGPIGVGAIYYCILYDMEMNTLTVNFTMCTVLMSIFIHGLSVPIYCFFRSLYYSFKYLFKVQNTSDSAESVV